MAKVSVRWEAPATAAAAASGDGKGAGASSLLHVLPPEAKAAESNQLLVEYAVYGNFDIIASSLTHRLLIIPITSTSFGPI